MSLRPKQLSTYGFITDTFALHSQSLLVSLLYGETLANTNWQNATEFFITKMSDATIAESLGWGSSGVGGLAARGYKMAAALAYSALDISSDPTKGVLVYGDTAIRSLFDDANDLGAAIVRVSGDPTGVSVALDEETKDFIGSIITNYAGALAYEKIARYGNNSQPDRTTGVLSFDDTGGSLSLNLDDDYWEFGSGEHDIVAKQDFLDHLFDTAGVSTDIGASLSWYSSSNSISSNLINSVTFDLNGQLDEIETSFLSPVGLNLILARDSVGGASISHQGDYIIIGGGAGEAIFGGSGKDIIFGSEGNDTLQGGEGNDWLDGGEGFDTADYSSDQSAVKISISSYDGITIRDGSGGLDELHAIDVIKGTIGRDKVRIEGTISTETDQLTIDANSGQSPSPEDTIDLSGSASRNTIHIDEFGNGAINDLDTGGYINLQGFHTNLLGSFQSDTITDNATGEKHIDAGAGNDIVSVSGTSGNAMIDGGDGDDMITGGSGNDVLVGGMGSDILSGGAGSDLLIGSPDTPGGLGDYLTIDELNGGDGADMLVNGRRMNGGAGNDVIDARGFINVGGDVTVTLGLGGGHDWIMTNGSGLTSGVSVIDLSVASKSSVTVYWDGDAANNEAGTLTVALSDGSSISIDNIFGTIIYNDSGEEGISLSTPSFIFSDGQTDIVSFPGQSDSFNVVYSSYSLADVALSDYHNGVGGGTVSGTSGDDDLGGSSGDDDIDAGEGNDDISLSGGDDSIDGGDGDDTVTFFGSVAGMALTQTGSGIRLTSTSGLEGSATVSNVENFYSITDDRTWTLAQLLGRISTPGDDMMIGTDEDDVLEALAGNDSITAYGGNDTLDGGSGADAMSGGAGDDTYYVDDIGDTVTESSNEGIDLVISSVSFTLGANVENLTLTGTANINGTGNTLANVITGNSGNNVLTGGIAADTVYGGDGNDTLNGGANGDQLYGGTGNDIYYLDNTADIVFEVSGEGKHDQVQTSISFVLGSAHIEKLLLLGTAAIDGIGNSLPNVIEGNSGNNVIDGVRGNDRLTGGGGADTFRFASTLGSTNVDAITDFTPGQDIIQLDQSYFTQLAIGALDASAFRSSGAVDADDRIIYDPTSGEIYYDADGSGATAAIMFATVTAGLALSASDFMVIA